MQAPPPPRQDPCPVQMPMIRPGGRTGERPMADDLEKELFGEALALQWGDIDFNGRFIQVRRSVVRGVVSTPKSGKSRRVDMSLQLSDTMKTPVT